MHDEELQRDNSLRRRKLRKARRGNFRNSRNWREVVN